MFWGVTIENGKKYSQIVEVSYHLSMAALEPTNKAPKDGSKLVSIMLEHMKTEFLLCTLEHGKNYQCALDLVFQEGEEVTFYLTGEGTVHLSGYIVGDPNSSEEESEDDKVEEKIQEKLLKLKSKAKKGSAEPDSDDDDDDDDDDWHPFDVPNASGKRSLNGLNSSMKKIKSEVSPDGKSPKQQLNMSAKKAKGNQQNTSQSKKLNSSLKNTKMGVEADSSDDEDEDDDDDEDSDDETGPLDLDDSDEGSELTDSDEEDDDKTETWGLTSFGGKKNPATPVSNKKKNKQSPQNSKLLTPQKQNNKGEQKQKTPQGGKGQQQTPQAGKNNVKSPQTGKKNQNKTPNQLNTSMKNNQADNSFNKTPGGKKQKKQADQQTPKPLANTENQSPKSPGGKTKKLAGGVQVEDVREGKGPVAKSGKYVHVYYTGKLNNNKEFDSLTKGKPFAFRLGKGEVIKGWDVALDGMKVGGKRKVVIPPSMGYGGKSQGPIPPNSTLHFEIELKAIQ